MRVTVIPIVVGTLETVSKGDWKSLKSKDESKPFRPQDCWDRPEYWEKAEKLEETCCHLDSNERAPVNAGVKNSLGTK